MDIEKLKQKMNNFDVNALVASVVSTFGSMNTEGIVTIGYFLIACVTTLLTLKNSQTKTKRDDEMRVQEIRLKEAEVQAKIIENQLKSQSLKDGKAE